MQLDDDKYLNLIFKESERRISPQEAAELHDWVENSDENRQLYKFFQRKRNIVTALKNLRRAEESKDLARFKLNRGLQQLNEAELTYPSPPRIPVLRQPLIKVVAAAAVVLVIGLALWDRLFVLTPNSSFPIRDLAPGGNRAVLTLSDGHKISLEKSLNGNLASQGTVQVIKLDSSLVSYASKASTNSHNLSKEFQYNTITTPKGGQFKIVLSDGTEVWLNAASSLRFPVTFSGNERTVDLIGEGFFDVAKNPNMPFRVKTPKMRVNVLGTKFNVRSYDDDTVSQTTLIEGSVKVYAGDKENLLRPGSRASYESSGKMDVSTPFNYLDDIGWVKGRFEFHRCSIETIMTQLARWYDVQVVYEGHPTGTFSGNPRRDSNASNVLSILRASGAVDFRIEGKKIIVLLPKDSMKTKN